MIKILFFAQTRELLGTSEMQLDIEPISVADLLTLLAQKNSKWHFALKEQSILAAVNHELVTMDFQINQGDEVAFFPPVTGG